MVDQNPRPTICDIPNIAQNTATNINFSMLPVVLLRVWRIGSSVIHVGHRDTLCSDKQLIDTRADLSDD